MPNLTKKQLQERLNQAKQELADTKELLSSAEDACEEMLEGKVKTVEKLHSKIADLERQCNFLKEKNKSLSAINDEKEDKIKDKTTTIQGKNREIKALERKLDKVTDEGTEKYDKVSNELEILSKTAEKALSRMTEFSLGGMFKYGLLKGKRRSFFNSLKNLTRFIVIPKNLSNKSELFYFDSSTYYTLPEEDSKDVNKLCGIFSLHPHYKSVRIGWIAEKEHLVLYVYVHNKGNREIKEFAKIPYGMLFSINMKYSKESIQIILKTPVQDLYSEVTIKMPIFIMRTSMYFGGTRPSPKYIQYYHKTIKEVKE